MDNKVKITALIFFFLIWAFITYEVVRKSSWNENVEKKQILKDSFIRNATWESGLTNDIPYVKWDEIEYVYILEENDWAEAKVDLSKVSERIDLQEVELNGEKIPLDNLNLKVDTDEITSIKIKWISKINKTEEENIEENIEVIVTQKRETLLEETQNIEENEDQEGRIKDVTNLIVNNYSFKSNIDSMLTIRAENVENITALVIWDYSLKPVFKDWIAYFNIEAWTFWTWTFLPFIEQKNGKIKTLDQAVTFIFVPGDVSIVNITPREIWNDVDRTLVLQWDGFDKVMSVQLSNNLVIKNTSFEVINNKVMSIKIPRWLDSWEYHFNIMTTKWISELKTEKFKIINKE